MALKVQGVVVVNDSRELTNIVTYNGYVPANRAVTVTGSSGITGGGDLSAARNLSIDETWVKARFSRFAILNSNTSTISTILGFGAAANEAAIYSHSTAGAPSDAPQKINSAGLAVSSSMWKEPLGFSVSAAGKAYIRGSTATEALPWFELWSSDNLPNPANTSFNIVAGNGLAGGGDLSATSRTLNVGAGNGIIAGADAISVKAGPGLVVDTSGVKVGAGNGIEANNTHTAVQAGNGLAANSTGVHVVPGNGLSTNSTSIFAVAGNGLTANSTGVHVVPGDGLSANSTTVFVDSTVVRSSSTLTAGNGLSGGGNAGSNLRFDVKTGNGLFANSSGLHVLAGTGLVANSTTLAIDSSVAISARNISTGWGLTGGGNLSADRTIAADQGVLDNRYVTKSANLNTGLGLVGGGVIGNGRTLSIDTAVVPRLDTLNTFTSTTNRFTSDLQILSTNSTNFSYLSFKNGANAATSAMIYSNPSDDRLYFRAHETGTTNFKVAYFEGAEGIFYAPKLSGDGSSISNLAGNQITTGTIPDDRLSVEIVRRSRAINSGNGLTGGGTLASDKTLSVQAGNGILVSSTGVHVNAGTGLTSNTTGVHINTGNGITANSSYIYVTAGSGISVTSSGVAVNAGKGLGANSSGVHVVTGAGITANDTHLYVVGGDGIGVSSSDVYVDSTVARTAISIVGGAGLVGGGNLGANRTISLGTPGTIGPDTDNSTSTTSHTHYISHGTIGELTSRLGTGVVGTYALLRRDGSNEIGPGTVISGSLLGYSSAMGETRGGRPPGTWRLMGSIGGSGGSYDEGNAASLFLRIA